MEFVIQEVVLGLIGIFFTALTLLVPVGIGYLRSRYAWLNRVNAIKVLEDVLLDLIHEAEETRVRELKKAREDGKLTEEDGARIRAEIVEKAKEILAPGQKKILEAITGDLTAYIASKLQRVFDDEKNGVRVDALVNP